MEKNLHTLKTKFKKKINIHKNEKNIIIIFEIIYLEIAKKKGFKTHKHIQLPKTKNKNKIMI